MGGNSKKKKQANSASARLKKHKNCGNSHGRFTWVCAGTSHKRRRGRSGIRKEEARIDSLPQTLSENDLAPKS